MNVILLTHEREVERPTNTGALALTAYPQWCRRITWSRVRPDKGLLQILLQPGAAVLYPAVTAEAPVDGKSGDTQGIESHSSGAYLTELPETLVIIDATWQEARKMIRQSPYLQQANKFALPEVQTSKFKLRRNQVDGGLCTLECIIRLCSLKGLTTEAEYLEQEFVSMNDTHRQ